MTRMWLTFHYLFALIAVIDALVVIVLITLVSGGDSTNIEPNHYATHNNLHKVNIIPQKITCVSANAYFSNSALSKT